MAYLAVAQATITSPIDGQVIAVNIAAGDSVTAASTTAKIVIQGNGGYEATTTVSLAKVAEVHVGATATVLPDGSSSAYSGKVVAVAAVPTTSSTGTTSFGVAIALDGDTSALHNGGIGSVSIVTGTSAATLAVPTSAVTTEGTLHTVEVYDGTNVTTTRVEVGVVGPVWTQITSGLTDGQQVVLAELDKALPSSATSSSNAHHHRTDVHGQRPDRHLRRRAQPLITACRAVSDAAPGVAPSAVCRIVSDEAGDAPPFGPLTNRL